MNRTTEQERQLQQILKAAEAGNWRKRQSKGLLTVLYFMPLITFATGIFLADSPKSQQSRTAETTDSTQLGAPLQQEHTVSHHPSTEKTLAKTQSQPPESEEPAEIAWRQTSLTSPDEQGTSIDPTTAPTNPSHLAAKNNSEPTLEQTSVNKHHYTVQLPAPRSTPSTVYKTANATIYTTGSTFDSQPVQMNFSNTVDTGCALFTNHAQSKIHHRTTSCHGNNHSVLHLHYRLNRSQKAH